jgi:hypothetical protein
MDLLELKEALIKEGWTITSNNPSKATRVDWEARIYFDGMTKCLANNKPPVIVVTPWDMGLQKEFAEVELRGKTPSGWASLGMYGFPMEMDAINNAVRSLTKSWEAQFRP